MDTTDNEGRAQAPDANTPPIGKGLSVPCHAGGCGAGVGEPCRSRLLQPGATGTHLSRIQREQLRARVAKLHDEAMTEGIAECSGEGSTGDRLRSANMAAGRAQAFRAVLAMLDEAAP